MIMECPEALLLYPYWKNKIRLDLHDHNIWAITKKLIGSVPLKTAALSKQMFNICIGQRTPLLTQTVCKLKLVTHVTGRRYLAE